MKGGHIVIAGGSGFLGQALARHFTSRGREVHVLTRSTSRVEGLMRFAQWDAHSLGEWVSCLENSAALINLSGRSVDCRYNERNKREIYDSRLVPTRLLGEALQQVESPPPVWLNASTGTIYRHALDRDMDESTGEHGSGFSVDVAEQWRAGLL